MRTFESFLVRYGKKSNIRIKNEVFLEKIRKVIKDIYGEIYYFRTGNGKYKIKSYRNTVTSKMSLNVFFEEEPGLMFDAISITIHFADILMISSSLEFKELCNYLKNKFNEFTIEDSRFERFEIDYDEIENVEFSKEEFEIWKETERFGL